MHKKEDVLTLILAIIALVVGLAIIGLVGYIGIKVVALLWLADMKVASIVTCLVFLVVLFGGGKHD